MFTIIQLVLIVGFPRVIVRDIFSSGCSIYIWWCESVLYIHFGNGQTKKQTLKLTTTKPLSPSSLHRGGRWWWQIKDKSWPAKWLTRPQEWNEPPAPWGQTYTECFQRAPLGLIRGPVSYPISPSPKLPRGKFRRLNVPDIDLRLPFSSGHATDSQTITESRLNLLKTVIYYC